MNNQARRAHLVGSGIANLAAAAYLIKDGAFWGANITIYEEEDLPGGALKEPIPVPEDGYMMRGERMFEENYVCFYDLCSFIPSLEDPNKTIKQDTLEFTQEYPWHNKARLVVNGNVVSVESYGFNEKDSLELLALTAKPESASNGKRITDVFSDHFFTTNFWHMWKTLFAFEPWHSAIEMRRYLLRFMHLFPDMWTQAKIHHTRYNQYDSVVRPLVKWLTDRGVQVVGKTRVTDIDIGDDETEITARQLVMVQDGKEKNVEVRSEDIVIATLGSMVANASFGTNDSPAQVNTSPQQCGSWTLWETLSKKRKDVFRDPSVFTGHVDESDFISFTATQRDPLFFQLVEKLSGNEAGRNGIISVPESNWMLTFILNHQPYFQNQPENIKVFYGLGLYSNKIGNKVKKPMVQCSGREILEELVHHLGFDEYADRILDSSIVRPCYQPFITSQFLVRKVSDRPDVVPHSSTNLALTGQFVEVPNDCVFTMESSVRSAQMAVYNLLPEIGKEPTPFQHVSRDIRVVYKAFKAMNT
jgi:oleate hydratase